MILELTGKLWCGRNWERLPEPLDERRRALDDVLRHAGLAGDRWILTIPLTDEHRTDSHLKAAQTYVTNAWMHTPWLTSVIARAMLGDLMSSLEKPARWLCRWWHNPIALIVAGEYLKGFATTRSLGILLLVAGIGEGIALLWIGYLQTKLEPIIRQVDSKIYSGKVLAERLERLNRFTLEVPSILVELLRI
jgi:hypothetical protein